MSDLLPDDCRACDSELVSLAFGESVDVPKAALDHLAGCARCRGALSELESTRRSFDTLPLEEPAAHLDDAVLAALDVHLAGGDVSRVLRLPEPAPEPLAPVPPVAAPTRHLALAPAAARTAGEPLRAPPAAPARRRWAVPGLAAAAAAAVLVGGTFLLEKSPNYAAHTDRAPPPVAAAPAEIAPAPIAPAPSTIAPAPTEPAPQAAPADGDAAHVSAPAPAALAPADEREGAARRQAFEASRAEAESMLRQAAAIAPGSKGGGLAAAAEVAADAVAVKDESPAKEAPAPEAKKLAASEPVAAPELRAAALQPASPGYVVSGLSGLGGGGGAGKASVAPPAAAPESTSAPLAEAKAAPAPVATILPAAKSLAAPPPVAPAPATIAPAPLVAAAKPAAPPPAEKAELVAEAPAAPAPAPMRARALAGTSGPTFGALRDDADAKSSADAAERPWEPLVRDLAEAKARSDWKSVAALGNRLALMGRAPESVRKDALAERVRALVALGDERGAKASARELERRWGLPPDLAGRF